MLLLLGIGEGLSEILSWLSGASDATEFSSVCRSAIKVVGVGYCFGICSAVCEELGEKGIASMLTNVGKVETFLVVFPYFKEIVKMGLGLIG